MPSGDRALERLRTAIDHAEAAEVVQLIAEARAEARARVRSLLSEAFTDSLLAQVQAELERRDSPTAAPESAPRQSQRPAGKPAWYVYGVVDAEAESVAAGLYGIAEEPVATMTEGPLAAVYSRVPREEFAESELRAHLSDMTWVENVARGHESVLDELCRLTTVIPMRMCTVYETDARVREMLDREQIPLQEALEHLEGKREWGVQAFFHPDRASFDADDGEAPDGAAGTGGSAGAAYMQRRRQERESKDKLEQLIDAASQEIHDSLAAVTADSALNPPQRPEATGRTAEMVLNGVYLVEDAAKDVFDDLVRELQSKFSPVGLELLITGPWPPYNFLPGSIGAAW